MFMLIDTASIVLMGMAMFVLTIGLGLSYGPQSALYAEMFPAHVRYSGVSIGYAIGAILGGAFAPLIAEVLLGASSGPPSPLPCTSWWALRHLARSPCPRSRRPRARTCGWRKRIRNTCSSHPQVNQ